MKLILNYGNLVTSKMNLTWTILPGILGKMKNQNEITVSF